MDLCPDPGNVGASRIDSTFPRPPPHATANLGLRLAVRRVQQRMIAIAAEALAVSSWFTAQLLKLFGQGFLDKALH